MGDYKSILTPMLDEYEGYSETPILDAKGNPTIGNGINLNDKNNHGILAMHGVDASSLINGGSITKEQNDAIRDTILKEKEDAVKRKVGPDVFDQLPDHKKAGLISMAYNSMNLVGPNLRQHIANNDDLAVGKEMLLNSNLNKDFGTLRRRTAEAKAYLGDEQFSKLQALLTDDEKALLNKIVNSGDNEHTKSDYLKQYSNILQKSNAPKPLDFSNLFNFNKKPTQ